MAAAASKPTPPTPRELDALAEAYMELKDQQVEAAALARALQADLDIKAEGLRNLAAEFGSVHAEKSKLLHGIDYEVMATFGQSVSVDAVMVEKFRAAASLELTKKTLLRIFDMDVRYRLKATAAEFIRTAKLSHKVKALYAACSVIKDRTPTLVVRAKEKEA